MKSPDTPPAPAPRSRAGRLAQRLLRHLPRGTIVLTAFTGLSVVLGYVREGVIAYYFGTSAEVDTFLVAFTLPRLLITLATTITVSALLPVYIGYVRGGESGRADELIQRWFSFLMGVLLLLAVGLALAAVPVMAGLAPGFDPAQTQHAARLLRGLLPYFVLAAAAASYKVVLDSHQRFGPPALARAVVTILVLATIIGVASRIGLWALVLGYSIGGVAMFTIHAVGARGLEARPRFRSLRWPRAAGLPLSGVGWVALQMTLGQVSSVVDRIFASGLDTGSIAALNYAVAITTAPQNFITAVLATVLFPVLSRKVAAGRPEAALRETLKWLGVIALITAPLIVAIIVYRVELVTLLLERGAFQRSSTQLVASVLTVLPISIAVGGANTLVNRLLLSQRAFRMAATLGGVTAVAKVVLNALLVGSMGVVGLALATVLTSVLGLVLRLTFAWRQAKSLSAADS